MLSSSPLCFFFFCVNGYACSVHVLLLSISLGWCGKSGVCFVPGIFFWLISTGFDNEQNGHGCVEREKLEGEGLCFPFSRPWKWK